MKVFEFWAMFPEGGYLVATGTDGQHTEDFGDRQLKAMRIHPHATCTLIRGEHVLNCEKFSLQDLRIRG